MPDRFESLRRALEGGPTPGPWFVDDDDRPGMEWNRQIMSAPHLTVCFMAHSDGDSPRQDKATADHIAACDPDTIRALLDERDDLARRLSTLKGEQA